MTNKIVLVVLFDGMAQPLIFNSEEEEITLMFFDESTTGSSCLF
jgi:hypothetical protein